MVWRWVFWKISKYVTGYVTGYKDAEDYYSDNGYDGPEAANSDSNLMWNEYIADFEIEQEVVMKK